MLRLRNTLTRRVEPVEPLEPGRVRMYTCGPTVYRYAHVGNLRSNLLADLIRRALLYHGVERRCTSRTSPTSATCATRAFDRGADPMLVAAGLESKTPAEIAAAYEAAFHADEALVNILPAHVFPRATEHIAEMLALAEALEDAGYAYATPEGNVYYAVAAFDGYGRLSGNTLADLRAGHRGDIEPDKRDPADFALWKAAGPGRLLKWPTARWGEGFPGWHLECSAMAMRYLGPRFDIHTGGIDNVFPHHEDEIAQSDADRRRRPGAPLGPRRVPADGRQEDGEVGRELPAGDRARRPRPGSAGVPLPGADLALLAQARVLGPLARRGRGRARIAPVGPARARARRRPTGPWAAPPVLRAGPRGDRPTGRRDGRRGPRRRVDRAIERAAIGPTTPAAPLSADGRALHDRFVAAIDDDLDMPVALALLREILRAPIAADERRWLVLDADAVLGLDLAPRLGRLRPGSSMRRRSRARSRALVADRDAARAARDYPRADALRGSDRGLGWDVIDTPDGTRARRRD